MKNNTKKNSNPVAIKDKKNETKVKELHQKEQESTHYLAAQHYSGPIPQPTDFEKYEKVLPGSADRILKMAENQSLHRQTLEKSVVYSGVQDSKRGQYFAFLLALVIIIGGFYLIAIDKDVVGVVAIVGSVGTLVTIFLYGRKSERDEREKKNN